MLRRAALLSIIPALAAAAPVLDRDLDNFMLLGIRVLRLKNFAMEPPGCNVGVDCERPNEVASCGAMRSKNATIAEPGQAAADQLCGTGDFHEVFRNVTGSCTPDCSMIDHPGPKSDCSTGFRLPLIGDVDGDGTPSCSGECDLDLDDIAARCGVTLPFPACDSTRPIIVRNDEDCSTDDLVPGNFQCDLPAGTYGLIQIRDGARIEFQPGTTVACGVRAGRATRVRSAGPATVIVPGKGRVRIGNSSDAGTVCDALSFVTERGSIHLGKGGEFAVNACAVAGTLHLGHGNNLKGRYVGLNIVMDRNNDGRCCGIPTTTTSTTTSSTTTNPEQSTTSTTQPGETTSTTSTQPGQTTTTATQPGVTTTSTTTASTTTTTIPYGAFTRTIGFYKNHPAVTQAILDEHGPLTVCGRTIGNVQVDHAESALEAMCGSPRGDQRLQLVRQLTAAALSTAAGGGQFDPTTCEAVCANPQATVSQLTACIAAADAFNNSGDRLRAPWDPPGSADSFLCEFAADTACTILSPDLCLAQ